MYETGRITTYLRFTALGLLLASCGTIGPSVEDVATFSAAQTDIAATETFQNTGSETSTGALTPTLVPAITHAPVVSVTADLTATEGIRDQDEDPVQEDVLDLCIGLNSWLEGHAQYVHDADSWDHDNQSVSENIHKTREHYEHILSLERGFIDILWPSISREARDLIENYIDALQEATNGYLDFLNDELTFDEYLDKEQELDDAYTVAFDAWENLAAAHDFSPYDCNGRWIPKPTPFPTWTPLPVSASPNGRP